MIHSEEDVEMNDLRQKIIGLTETSHRKSYYPQLKEQINELSIAMDALQESENKYRTLVENVNIGIIRTEPGKVEELFRQTRLCARCWDLRMKMNY